MSPRPLVERVVDFFFYSRPAELLFEVYVGLLPDFVSLVRNNLVSGSVAKRPDDLTSLLRALLRAQAQEVVDLVVHEVNPLGRSSSGRASTPTSILGST
jgi:hypothetical protein